jgi:hypothetical protein
VHDDPTGRHGDILGPQTLLAFRIHEDEVAGASILERIGHDNLIPRAAIRSTVRFRR